eukprot:CAMPEP_0197575236 /NCGR_PEP_ID=MMETSP1326-20131121/695_1 /TAXON_ID=1155430 /ORGANISM="Genus nov. species nov., Strain RCC2288" /LENGTH=305 /DNA_ID=CAMNT_0043137969 /DNA_START=43 /DNA_END=960 /DNA_ORIENTATION=-
MLATILRLAVRRARAAQAVSPAAALTSTTTTSAAPSTTRALFTAILTGAPSTVPPQTALAAVAAMRHAAGSNRVAAAASSGAGFHSSSAAAVDDRSLVAERADEEKGLSEVLSEELEHEQSTYQPSEVVASGPPEPFEIMETDGNCEIVLTRSYGDDEEIAVSFIASSDAYGDEDDMYPEQNGEEDEDEGEDEVTVLFDVSVTQGDGKVSLEFNCATDGDTVEVRHLNYIEEDGDDDGFSTTYDGPSYTDLDESVQEEFHKYLEARGINSTLANFIMEAHVDKEQREYTRWLENVSNFVAPKIAK